MAETTSQYEQMPEENGYIDLTDSMNSATLDEVKQMGAIGKFISRLVEQGIREKKKVLLHGLNTMTLKIRYDQEEVSFMLKPSVDQGGDAITHAHFELRMQDYKKPWVQGLIQPEESGEWLKILPLTFAGFCQELTGQDLRLMTLEEQFPKLTYNNMKDVINDESRGLDQYFSYDSKRSAGAWGFYMTFKTPELQQRYLQNDPQLLADLRSVVEGFIPVILSKLRDLNAKKAA